MFLELSKKVKFSTRMARSMSKEMLRPISRKYDKAEHEYPKELDLIGSMIRGMNEGDPSRSAGAAASKGGSNSQSNVMTAASIQATSWGDLGLMLSFPGQGLGNSAIAAVANEEQKQRFAGKWAAMAITEPGTGSDSGAIRTTAVKDGDYYILNGEKIYITSGYRADLIVVWATLDPKLGKAAIKSFVVEKGTEGLELMRLEHKLGIKASDTANYALNNCRVHKDNLLGDPEVRVEKGFGGVMQTFDNTRPMVAAMAIGVAEAALDTTKVLLKQTRLDKALSKPLSQRSAIEQELINMQADWEAARLLMLKAAWMADSGKPNSKEASMSKAKAGRTCNAITLKCVELCGSLGYSERELLEKWARDSKILDIFEGTQQIQQLIIARHLLNKSSKELK
ncbi:MAG: acyl-CoA dehydrogenase family protein [Pseudomonadota bacterium]|nr:acyl-CoA dehydrogenase family protein [Pseudomonadota bacterium]